MNSSLVDILNFIILVINSEIQKCPPKKIPHFHIYFFLLFCLIIILFCPNTIYLYILKHQLFYHYIHFRFYKNNLNIHGLTVKKIICISPMHSLHFHLFFCINLFIETSVLFTDGTCSCLTVISDG